MGVQQVTIPIRGVDTQPLNDQSLDGICASIVNLKPKGPEQNPYWVPFEVIESLQNTSNVALTYAHGIANIKGAYWQLRNRINDKFRNTSSISLKRLIVLCDAPGRKAIDVIDPINWSIVKTFSLPSLTNYSFSCTRIGEITIVNIIQDGDPYQLIYLIDDTFIGSGYPNLPRMAFDVDTRPAGTNLGVQKDKDRFLLVRFAFKLFDGSYVKHSNPILYKVESGSGFGAQDSFELPQFTLQGYDTPIENKDFWETQISGVACFCTDAFDTEKQALESGLFYELAFFPQIDRIANSDWPSESDPNIVVAELSLESWLTQRQLDNDNFTHHNLSGKVINSYNQRLLLGGVGTNFGLPLLNITASGGATGNRSDFLTVANETYNIESDYYDSSGNVVEPQEVTPDYSIENEFASFRFEPVQSGYEIKSASIVSEPTLTTATTPDGSTVPAQTNTVQNNTANAVISMDRTTSVGYGSISGDLNITVAIGPIGGGIETTMVMVINIGGNSLDITNFSISGGSNVTYNLFFEVTILSDNGEFKRVGSSSITTDGTTLSIPKLLSYPDRRATKIKAIIQEGADYRLLTEKTLIKHPNSNYSYVLLTDAEATYTMGSGTLTTALNDTVNVTNSFINNQVTASLTSNPFVFDAATFYRIGDRNDNVLGFAVNDLDISEGQFGQFPLYVLTDKSIWALQQDSTATVAFLSLVPVSTENGINNPLALCNAQRTIIAADNNFIYALSGKNITRIDWPISDDSEYQSFLQGIQLAYHYTPSYQEIVCSNPNFNYSWYYNLRYKTWYKGSDSFKFFWQDQPSIYGITTSNELKEFDRKNSAQTVSWSLATRPMNLGVNDPYSLKRLRSSYLRSRLQQPNQANELDYLDINLEVLGYTQNTDSPHTILKHLYKKEIVKDVLLTTGFSGFQNFEIHLDGQNSNEGSYIHEFNMAFNLKQRRRLVR